MSNKVNASFDEDLMANFSALAKALSLVLHQGGLEVRPVADENLSRFRSLSPSQQRLTLAQINQDLEIIQSTIRQVGHINDTPQLTWQALKKVKLIAPSDFLSYVHNGDIIEFYDLNSYPLFRSFSFFKLTGYSLEELYSQPWHHLFVREEQTMEHLLTKVKLLLSGQIKGVVQSGIPEHILTEADTVNKNQIRLKVEYLAPLYSIDHKLKGYAAIERGNRITKDLFGQPTSPSIATI